MSNNKTERHQRALAHIARMEMELGIGDETPELMLDDLARRWASSARRGFDRVTMCALEHEDVVRRAWDLGLVNLSECVKLGYVPQYPSARVLRGWRDTDKPIEPSLSFESNTVKEM